jgi:hypothetical protein
VLLLHRFEGLFKVIDDVVDVLGADGKADGVWFDALFQKFRFTELGILLRTVMAPNMVSSSKNRDSRVLVASSISVIRQQRPRLPSNQSWRLPSNWTNSPKCSPAVRRERYSLRFSSGFHSPQAISARLNVLTLIATPSVVYSSFFLHPYSMGRGHFY